MSSVDNITTGLSTLSLSNDFVLPDFSGGTGKTEQVRLYRDALLSSQFEKKPIPKIAAETIATSIALFSMRSTLSSQADRTLLVHPCGKYVTVVAKADSASLRHASEEEGGAYKRFTSSVTILLDETSPHAIETVVASVYQGNDLSKTTFLESEEANLTAMQHTPHVVRYFGKVSDSNSTPQTSAHNIIFERCIGDFFHMATGSIETKDLRIDQFVQLQLMLDVIKGLFAMHKARILYFDVKPDNFLIRKNKDDSLEGVVADLGASRTETQESPSCLDLGLYSTPAFTSPELFGNLGKKFNFNQAVAMDLFALGLSFYLTFIKAEYPFWSTFARRYCESRIFSRPLSVREEYKIRYKNEYTNYFKAMKAMAADTLTYPFKKALLPIFLKLMADKPKDRGSLESTSAALRSIWTNLFHEKIASPIMNAPREVSKIIGDYV